MKNTYTLSLTLTLTFTGQVAQNTPAPAIDPLLASLLDHPWRTGHVLWERPMWKQQMGPWDTLEEVPCEPGDWLIEVRAIAGITRTLLVRVSTDLENHPVVLLHPRAEEESVERAVWRFLRTTYRSYRYGLYPCSPALAADLLAHADGGQTS